MAKERLWQYWHVVEVGGMCRVFVVGVSFQGWKSTSMLGGVKICAILHLHGLKCAFHQPPELTLDSVLWHAPIRVSCLLEPVLLEGVTLLLEAAEGVLFAFLESEFISCNKTFGTIPVGLWDTVQWWRQAVHVVSQLTTVADQHLVQVAFRVTYLADIR